MAAGRGACFLLGAAFIVAACGGDGGGSAKRSSTTDGESPPGLIAYESYQPDNLVDVYVMYADGTGKRPLIRSSEPEGWPAWSPDGTKIAFVTTGVGGSEDVHVMSLDEGNPLNVTAHPAYTDRHPTWSPDGRRLAFTSSRDRRSDSDPAWSPDGTRIAFERDSDLYVANVDGIGLSRLTRTEAFEFSPAWSPDGEEIAFHRDSDISDRASYYDINDQFAIWIMDARGGGARRLLPPGQGPPGQTEPTWSPDGRWIAFRSHRPEDEGEQCQSIYVAKVDGSKVRQVTRCTRRWGAGHWLGSADYPSWGVDAERP